MNGYRIQKQSHHIRWVVMIMVAAGLAGVGFWWQPSTSSKPRLASPLKAVAVASTPKPLPPQKPKVLGTFTGEQFTFLYQQLHYAHTTRITSPPPITGDEAADTHIRTIAQARGYKLRSQAATPLGMIDGTPLQASAINAWQVLKATAQKEGLGLRLVAGYRSFEDQQLLFTRALTAAGIHTGTIAGGTADTIINGVMQTVSIPGYSKHHTGYTIDIGCDTPGTFVTTPCFQWLSLNNYANAKRAGWIPSYPAGSGGQGPMPEPWEYVWVGVDALMREAP